MELGWGIIIQSMAGYGDQEAPFKLLASPASWHFVVPLSEQQYPETAPGRDTSSLQHKNARLIFLHHKVSTKRKSISAGDLLQVAIGKWRRAARSLHLSPLRWSEKLVNVSQYLISLIQNSLRKAPGSGMPLSKKRLAIEGPQCLRLPCKGARHS